MGNRRRVAERRKTKPAVIGGVIAVVVGGAGFGAYALYGGGAAADDGTRSTSASDDHKKDIPSGPLSATEVTTTARTFLTAWQQGKVSRAAAATSDTEAATALLTGYTKDAHLKDVTLTAGTRTGDKVPFSVKATVSYKGTEKPLKYDSALTVVRDTTDGKPRVDWHSSVVHPDLKDGDTLVTGASGTPPVKAVDRDGGEITTAKYPSLGTVLDGLREKYGKTAGGKAGIELRVIRGKSAKAAKASDKTLLELSKGTPGTVKTTLNPTLQAAAERQVAKKAKSSVVVDASLDRRDPGRRERLPRLQHRLPGLARPRRPRRPAGHRRRLAAHRQGAGLGGQGGLPRAGRSSSTSAAPRSSRTSWTSSTPIKGGDLQGEASPVLQHGLHQPGAD
ncbi:hypothetical protein SALBM311S_04177 [Streptomyces alboniger]